MRRKEKNYQGKNRGKNVKIIFILIQILKTIIKRICFKLNVEY